MSSPFLAPWGSEILCDNHDMCRELTNATGNSLMICAMSGFADGATCSCDPVQARTGADCLDLNIAVYIRYIPLAVVVMPLSVRNIVRSIRVFRAKVQKQKWSFGSMCMVGSVGAHMMLLLWICLSLAWGFSGNTSMVNGALRISNTIVIPLTMFFSCLSTHILPIAWVQVLMHTPSRGLQLRKSRWEQIIKLFFGSLFLLTTAALFIFVRNKEYEKATLVGFLSNMILCLTGGITGWRLSVELGGAMVIVKKTGMTKTLKLVATNENSSSKNNCTTDDVNGATIADNPKNRVIKSVEAASKGLLFRLLFLVLLYGVSGSFVRKSRIDIQDETRYLYAVILIPTNSILALLAVASASVKYMEDAILASPTSTTYRRKGFKCCYIGSCFGPSYQIGIMAYDGPSDRVSTVQNIQSQAEESEAESHRLFATTINE